MPWHTSPVFTSPQNHRATPWYFSPKRYRQQQKRYCKKQPRQHCLACYPPTAVAGGAKVPAGKKNAVHCLHGIFIYFICGVPPAIRAHQLSAIGPSSAGG